MEYHYNNNSNLRQATNTVKFSARLTARIRLAETNRCFPPQLDQNQSQSLQEHTTKRYHQYIPRGVIDNQAVDDSVREKERTETLVKNLTPPKPLTNKTLVDSNSTNNTNTIDNESLTSSTTQNHDNTRQMSERQSDITTTTPTTDFVTSVLTSYNNVQPFDLLTNHKPLFIDPLARYFGGSGAVSSLYDHTHFLYRRMYDNWVAIGSKIWPRWTKYVIFVFLLHFFESRRLSYHRQAMPYIQVRTRVYDDAISLWASNICVDDKGTGTQDQGLNQSENQVDQTEITTTTPNNTLKQNDITRSSPLPQIQIVLIGAGFDSRVYRLPALRNAAVYEIDQLEVLQYKQSLFVLPDDAPNSPLTTIPNQCQCSVCGMETNKAHLQFYRLPENPTHDPSLSPNNPTDRLTTMPTTWPPQLLSHSLNRIVGDIALRTPNDCFSFGIVSDDLFHHNSHPSPHNTQNPQHSSISLLSQNVSCTYSRSQASRLKNVNETKSFTLTPPFSLTQTIHSALQFVFKSEELQLSEEKRVNEGLMQQFNTLLNHLEIYPTSITTPTIPFPTPLYQLAHLIATRIHHDRLQSDPVVHISPFQTLVDAFTADFINFYSTSFPSTSASTQSLSSKEKSTNHLIPPQSSIPSLIQTIASHCPTPIPAANGFAKRLNWILGLFQTGFNPHLPTLFAIEGVLMYLPSLAVKETMLLVRDLCSFNPQSQLITDIYTSYAYLSNSSYYSLFKTGYSVHNKRWLFGHNNTTKKPNSLEQSLSTNSNLQKNPTTSNDHTSNTNNTNNTHNPTNTSPPTPERPGKRQLTPPHHGDSPSGPVFSNITSLDSPHNSKKGKTGVQVAGNLSNEDTLMEFINTCEFSQAKIGILKNQSYLDYRLDRLLLGDAVISSSDGMTNDDLKMGSGSGNGNENNESNQSPQHPTPDSTLLQFFNETSNTSAADYHPVLTPYKPNNLIAKINLPVHPLSFAIQNPHIQAPNPQTTNSPSNITFNSPSTISSSPQHSHSYRINNTICSIPTSQSYLKLKCAGGDDNDNNSNSNSTSNDCTKINGSAAVDLNIENNHPVCLHNYPDACYFFNAPLFHTSNYINAKYLFPHHTYQNTQVPLSPFTIDGDSTERMEDVDTIDNQQGETKSSHGNNETTQSNVGDHHQPNLDSIIASQRPYCDDETQGECLMQIANVNVEDNNCSSANPITGQNDVQKDEHIGFPLQGDGSMSKLQKQHSSIHPLLLKYPPIFSLSYNSFWSNSQHECEPALRAHVPECNRFNQERLRETKNVIFDPFFLFQLYKTSPFANKTTNNQTQFTSMTDSSCSGDGDDVVLDPKPFSSLINLIEDKLIDVNMCQVSTPYLKKYSILDSENGDGSSKKGEKKNQKKRVLGAEYFKHKLSNNSNPDPSSQPPQQNKPQCKCQPCPDMVEYYIFIVKP